MSVFSERVKKEREQKSENSFVSGGKSVFSQRVEADRAAGNVRETTRTKVETHEQEKRRLQNDALTPLMDRYSSSFDPENDVLLMDEIRETAGLGPSFFNRTRNMFAGAARGSGASYTNVGGNFLEGMSRLNDAAFEQQYAEQVRAQQNSLDYWTKVLENATTEDEAERAREQIARAENAIQSIANFQTMQTADIDAASAELYKIADEMAAKGEANVAQAKEGLGAVGQFAVDAGVGGLQLAGDIAAGIATGGGAMLPMTLRVYGGNTQKARQHGASFAGQVAYGAGGAALAAATEALSSIAKPLQKAFGSTGIADDVIIKLAGKLNDTAAGRIVLSALSEGAEEAIESVAEPLLQRITYDKEAGYNADTLSDVAYDFLLGAVLGGAVGGVGEISTNIEASKKYGSSSAELVEEALSVNPESKFAQKMQKKVESGKTLSGGQITKLVNKNESAIIDKDIATIETAVTKRLEDLGETENISAISNAIAKQAAGKEISKKERQAIASSVYGKMVAEELEADNIESGSYDTEWTRKIGTDKVNYEAYNADLLALADEVAGASKGIDIKSVAPNTTHFTASQSGDAESAEVASVENGEQTKDKDIALIRSSLTDMGINAAGAEALMKNYDGTGGRAYGAGIALAYQYGKMNFPKSYLVQASLKPHQAELAYNLGRSDAKAEIYAPKVKRVVKGKQGTITYETAVDRTALNNAQNASLDGIEAIVALTNLDVHVFMSDKNNGFRYTMPDGAVRSANGWYVPGTNEIWIDINAGNTGEGTMLYTFAHEITHYIKEWSPKKWRELADFLMEQYGNKNVPVAELLQMQMDKISSRDSSLTGNKLKDAAYEELVSDAMSEMLVDGNVAQKLAELKRKDKTLWEKIGEAIKNLLERWGLIRQEYANHKPSAEEAQFLRSMDNAFKKLQDMYTEAFVDAEANFAAAAEEVLQSNAKPVAEAIEFSDINTKFSIRESDPPKKTIIAYKAFYAHDGKLYPPMVANLAEEEQAKIKGAVSGTLKALETPVGVWVDADVGGIATYSSDVTEYDIALDKAKAEVRKRLKKQGYDMKSKATQALVAEEAAKIAEGASDNVVHKKGEVIRNTTGRLAVQNAKSGGDATLAFRPGWHLGEWPDAKQFNKDSALGARSVMPDSLVFCKCEIAADVDYQLDAMSYGVNAKGKFDRTQAGLPRVPVDGYYKYRTNVDPTTAPWYITGAMRVVEVLDDADCARICAEYGVTPDPRENGKPIDLAAYGLKRGPVVPTKDLGRFKKNQKNLDNEAMLERALTDPAYANAYVQRDINFDDPEIVKEFERNRQSAEEYRKKADENLLVNIDQQRYNYTIKESQRTTPYIGGTFPPFNYSHSDANEQAIRWAHRNDVNSGDEKMFYYRGSWYLVQALDSADLGYQIVEKLTHRQYLNYLEEANENGDTASTKSVQERSNRISKRDRERKRSGGREQSDDSSSVEQRGKNRSVQRMGSEQTDKRGTASYGNGDLQSGSAGGEADVDAVGLVTYSPDYAYWRNALKDPDGEGYLPSDRDSAYQAEADINRLRNEIDSIDDELLFAEGVEEKTLRNKRVKLQAQLDKLLADERKATKRTSLQVVLDNLDKYRRSDLESIANQLTDGAWDEAEEMSTADLIDGIKEVINDRALSPLEMQAAKFGVYVRDVSDWKFSDRDSDGRQLSAAQQEFFKDSEVRDDDGNLLPVYHSTSEEFNTFEVSNKSIYGEFYYFAVSKTWSKKFHKEERYSDPKYTKKCYLNLTNVFDLRVEPNYTEWGSGGFYGNEWIKYIQEKGVELDDRFVEMWSTPQKNEHRAFGGVPAWALIRYDGFTGLRESLIAAGYDGIVYYDIARGRVDNTVYVAFHQNQIKLASNKNPTTDPDIRYSERDIDSVSNRVILSNAFAEIATNDTERAKIAEYQQNIQKINELEDKLADIRKELGELSFSKGPRDQARIKALRYEATKTANRISNYDKILLRLEASAPLKSVLEREKKLAYSRASQKWQDRIDTARTGRSKTEMRHKVQKITKELNNLLLHGTKEKHVMIGLQKETADALSAVNIDTVAADKRLAEIQKRIDSATDPVKRAQLEQTYARVEEMGENMRAKLVALQDAYSDIKNSDDPLVKNAHHPEIAERIEALRKMVGNTPLRNMTMEQLEYTYDTYKMVLTTIRNANKAFKNERGATIEELGTSAMQEIEAVGGKKNLVAKAAKGLGGFAWSGLKPVYAFKAIGSETLSELFDEVRAGEDTWAVDVSEAKDFYRQKTKQYNYDSWDFDKQYSFKSNTGKEFKLTLEQIMSLYAYSKRKQADEHLSKGGFVFDDAIEVKEKKRGIPITYMVNTATAHNLSIETLAEICNTLTDEQAKFVDDMQNYLSTTMGDKGNEVSLKMYGVKLFNEKFYFPLKSSKQFMREQNEVAGDRKIKNSGFSKETKPHANNPVILSNFTEVWAKHVSDMAMYHAFVLPLEDFNRVYEYKTPNTEDTDSTSVKSRLRDAYAGHAEQYIRNLLTDLNGGARSDPNAGIINKGIGMFKKAAVFASLSVVIQQPSAIARAGAYIDAKYFVGKPSNKAWDEVKKYAPVAIIKDMGYFDTNMGMSTVDFIKAKEYEGAKEKMKAVVTDSQFRDEVLSKAPAVADEMAWCQIWEAVKKEVADKQGLSGEALLKAAGKRFTEVIVNTQVYDSVLSRSGLMRSKDTGMKMATAFMAEPTTSLNMITNAIIQAKRGDKKGAVKAIGSVAASMILNSILVSIVYAGRDDDEDKTYLEKYAGTLTSELIDSFNPLTLIPFVKDIVSIMQGYDVERSDMAIVTDLYKAWKNLSSSKRTAYRKVEDFAGAVAAIFGLPVKNIMRDARGMYNTVMSAFKGERTTARGVGEALREAVTGKERSNAEQLYSAMLNNDTAQVKRVKARFKDDKEIAYAIRDGLVANDKRITQAAEARVAGNQSEYTRLAKAIVNEKHFTQDDVVRAINYVTDKLRKGDEETASGLSTPDTFKVVDYYNEAKSGDRTEADLVKREMIASLMAEGKTAEEAEKSFNNSFKNSAVKEAFNDGELTMNAAIAMLQNYGGFDKNTATADVQYWDFKNNYPDTYVEDSWFDKYYEDIAASGMNLKTYVDYRNKVKGVDGKDKKTKRMAIINSFPISDNQKDALYYSEGWSASTIREAPWH